MRLVSGDGLGFNPLDSRFRGNDGVENGNDALQSERRRNDGLIEFSVNLPHSDKTPASRI